MKVASITELKNDLSVYLKGVTVGGEPVLVTDRRKPVAILQPISKGWWDERMVGLVAGGIVAPSEKALHVGEFLKTPRGKSKKSLTRAVIEDRDGR
jgi:prevent-host-death family protein